MASWIDLVKVDFTITTGDGAVYKPLWVNARKAKKFKIAQFDFKGIAGSLIKKGEPYASVYEIEIIFQGAQHLDDARSFYDSADNKKPWTVTHPFYGPLYVQCAEIEQDNSKLNVSRITATIIETILDNGLQPVLFSPDIVAAQVTQVNDNLNETYVSYLQVPKISDYQKLLNHITSIYKSISGKIAVVQEDVTAYQNAFNEATAVITTAISLPGAITTDIIGEATALIMAPAKFADTVANRIAMYQTTLDILKGDVSEILTTYGVNTQSLKKLYENNAGTAIGGICLSAMSNITTDYNYMPDVLSVIGSIITSYNAYIANIIALQTPNGGQLDSYIPDANSIISLQQMVFTTTKALYAISAGALQQKTYFLPYDDNLINVTYLLYGSDPDDTKKQTLIANNNIGLDELLTLKQGRKILYYA